MKCRVLISLNIQKRINMSSAPVVFNALRVKIIRGMFEMNCLLSSSSISTWGTIKTKTYLYRAIQYLHNGV